MSNPPQGETSDLDQEIAALLTTGEAGVGDVIRVFEQIERIYVAALDHSSLPDFEGRYSTGTFAY